MKTHKKKATTPTQQWLVAQYRKGLAAQKPKPKVKTKKR